ncbi:MAG TPA: vanadium-dependent haloperoxidase [Candidatus Binatia bacterium]|nr:vanadium-dependent haloperoxidase [Candidatus Binatia bacterium]
MASSKIATLPALPMTAARLVPACLLIVLSAPAAHAQAQNAFQRGCFTRLHAAAVAVAESVGNRIARCAQRTVTGVISGGALESCLHDSEGLVETALDRTRSVEAAWCESRPAFGASDADDINDAVRESFDLDAAFGDDPGAAFEDATGDPVLARCRIAVAHAVAGLTTARIRSFHRCTRRGLKSRSLQNAVSLSTCLDGRGQGHVEATLGRAQALIASACATTPPVLAAPGSCGDADGIEEVAGCLDRAAACAVCEQFEQAQDAPALCDLYDDSVRNGSCTFPQPPGFSVARVWDEALLEAIRRDTPRPTVHGRNLFHLSAAMYDAWTAYHGDVEAAYFVDETPTVTDAEAEAEEAISYAAYRLLTHRFANGVSGANALLNLDYWLRVLGYDPAVTTTAGGSAAAVGNRIGAAVIAHGLTDGSNEQAGYADDTGYFPENDPLIVAQPGAPMNDPNRWQPLALAFRIEQNGIPAPSNIQTYVGPHWGNVTPFALTRENPDDVYVDPGPPPLLGGTGDFEFKHSALQVLRLSSRLDGNDPTLLNISPGARGNNPLGTNDGSGHPINPSTGLPYEDNIVRRADWGRLTAEYWADGPSSETPPGHWNVLANDVSYHEGFERRFGGEGEVLGELEWDVKLYFVLNGAVHDAAIAAWNAKRAYDTARPISMIRYMSQRGQSSNPDGPSYHALGIPLEDGLVEIITAESSAPGQRHEHLAAHVGQVAVRSWLGTPADRENDIAGVGWLRGIEWITYQLPTFVTPAFPGYVSGHSTFSRSAAVVMASITGSEFFPGGIHEVERPVGSLDFEFGPVQPVTLQWATYFDAADDAGISRLWGGIHIRRDDFGGRIMGATIGQDAWNLANAYFDGTN